jgi:hypothetical protein
MIVLADIATALGRIVEYGFDPFDASLGALAMITIGDALRLKIPIPRAVIEATAGLTEAQLSAIARSARELAIETRRPGGDDDLVEEAVVCRDRLVSFAAGLRRVALGRGLLVAEVDEYADLLAAIDALHAMLVASVSREAADRALGDRRSLLDRGGDWTLDLVPERVTDGEAYKTSPAMWTSLDGALPPDAIVDRYIAAGHAKAWVEGAAAADPAFRDRLEVLVATEREAAKREVGRRDPLWDWRNAVKAPWHGALSARPVAGPRAAGGAIPGVIGGSPARGSLEIAGPVQATTTLRLKIVDGDEPPHGALVTLYLAGVPLAKGEFDDFGIARLGILPSVELPGEGLPLLETSAYLELRFEVV